MISVGNRHHGDVGIYVGRGTPLGNQFRLKQQGGAYTREQSLLLYREWLRREWRLNGNAKAELLRLAQLSKIGNLMLICSCKPLDCHADVIKSAIEGIVRAQGN